MQLLKSDLPGPSQQIAVRVNGRHLNVAPDTSVAQLLVEIGIRSALVAVEVNLDLVPKQSHATRLLQAGDEVEVVTVVGGG